MKKPTDFKTINQDKISDDYRKELFDLCREMSDTIAPFLLKHKSKTCMAAITMMHETLFKPIAEQLERDDPFI